MLLPLLGHSSALHLGGSCPPVRRQEERHGVREAAGVCAEGPFSETVQRRGGGRIQ